MFNLIAILFTLFGTFHSDDINVSYNSKLEAIVINGFDSKEIASNCEVAVYYGKVSTNPEISRVIGNYEHVCSLGFYKPKYGFSKGATYTVIITTDGVSTVNAKRQYRFVVNIPKTEVKPTTHIESVYPSGLKLPMNQLKLYIEFSAPMKTGNAFDYIHLYKMPEGELQEDAFLIMPDELWDEQRMCLTILFDPGRIKRGIQPNLQLGLPLVEGNNYKLLIDENWLDNNGAQLTTGYEKTFEIIAVDRTAPNKDNWEISIPEQVTKSPIVIDFKEPMDYGLMQSALVIVDKNSKPVRGKVHLNNHESIWSFTPQESWVHGDYEIVIDAWLEDLAGNSLRRKFDINLTDPLDNVKNIKEVIIPFKIN